MQSVTQVYGLGIHQVKSHLPSAPGGDHPHLFGPVWNPLTALFLSCEE